MRAAYVLTDGNDVLDCRMMTPEEAAEANEVADRATNGNLWWGRVDPAFLDECPARIEGRAPYEKSSTRYYPNSRTWMDK